MIADNQYKKKRQLPLFLFKLFFSPLQVAYQQLKRNTSPNEG